MNMNERDTLKEKKLEMDPWFAVNWEKKEIFWGLPWKKDD